MSDGFCACGHEMREHAYVQQLPGPGQHRVRPADTRCLATEPDRCACQGFHYGKRSN